MDILKGIFPFTYRLNISLGDAVGICIEGLNRGDRLLDRIHGGLNLIDVYKRQRSHGSL